MRMPGGPTARATTLGLVIAAVIAGGAVTAAAGFGSTRPGAPSGLAALPLSATTAPGPGRPPATGASPGVRTPGASPAAPATAPPLPARTSAAAGTGQPSPTGHATAGSAHGVTSSPTAAPRRPAASRSTAPSATATARADAGAAPGQYPVSESGSITAGTFDQDESGAATLTVDPAIGQAQTQTLKGSDATTVEKLVFGTGRLDATELSITSQVLDADFVLTPQEPLAVLSDGASWSWQAESTDGKEHLALSGSYGGAESVSVGGTAYPTDIVKSTLTLTGSVATTITETDDVSPALGLDLRIHQIAKGAEDGVAYTSDATFTLTSTTPS